VICFQVYLMLAVLVSTGLMSIITQMGTIVLQKEYPSNAIASRRGFTEMRKRRKGEEEKNRVEKGEEKKGRYEKRRTGKRRREERKK
jgi:hypothetical protein